eukprot:3939288-Rhodomonas_salina.2
MTEPTTQTVDPRKAPPTANMRWREGTVASSSVGMSYQGFSAANCVWRRAARRRVCRVRWSSVFSLSCSTGKGASRVPCRRRVSIAVVSTRVVVESVVVVAGFGVVVVAGFAVVVRPAVVGREVFRNKSVCIRALLLAWRQVSLYMLKSFSASVFTQVMHAVPLSPI